MEHSTSPSKGLFNFLRAWFPPKTPLVDEDQTANLWGDYEGTGLTRVIKHPYTVSNTDENGTPIDTCYITDKWVEFPKSSILNAADLDSLWIAYGKSEADAPMHQLSNPSAGHSATLQAIAAWEVSDFESLCKNQEAILASLEEAYSVYDRIRSSRI